MKPAAKAKRTLSVIENWGGFDGSQRHCGGVHVRKVEILRTTDGGDDDCGGGGGGGEEVEEDGVSDVGFEIPGCTWTFVVVA